MAIQIVVLHVFSTVIIEKMRYMKNVKYQSWHFFKILCDEILCVLRIIFVLKNGKMIHLFIY